MSSETQYLCPMHSDVRQPYPGKCPRCGMDLIAEGTRFGLALHAGVHHTHDSLGGCRRRRPPSERLTPRERQVLQLVAEGKTTKEIATILGVSVKTCESHRTRVMQKLGIHTAAGLVRYAIREGLVNP